MNEATLEGNLNAALDKLFRGPLRLKIEHQTVLSLHFGHHGVTVDGESRSTALGRLDVLLSADKLPLALLELKRPGLALTQDDETQAWSYARLIHPMPPLYIVTNGADTRIFRTYDREPLAGQSVDEELLAAQVQAAARAAAGDEVVAIRFLLGRSPDVFRQLFQTVTEAELSQSTGAVDDYTQPIANDFRLPRAATVPLVKLLMARQPTVVLTGAALSGKTNVAAALCWLAHNGPPEARGLIPLYINCGQRPQGLFQSLATGLTKQTKVPATADDVRQWLTLGVITTEVDRPVVILDGWPAANGERWAAELSELLELAGESSFSLVVVLDDGQADTLLRDPSRGHQTPLAQKAKVVRVRQYLSHEEFCLACHTLGEHNSLGQELGAERNVFFRLPYTWRFLASLPEQRGIVPAVVGVELLHAVRNAMKLAPELREYLRRYARAVAEEDVKGALREVLLGSPGWVTWETAERVLGVRGMDRLVEARLIRGRVGPRGRTLVSIQVPPILAAAAAELIGEQLEAKAGQITVSQAADELLQPCPRFPYGPIVGADVVLSWGADESLVSELLSREPTIQPVPANAKLALPIEGQESHLVADEVLCEAIKDGCDHMFDNVLPYMLLSHVVRCLDLRKPNTHDKWVGIVDAVGSAGVPLIPIEPVSKEYLRVTLPHRSYHLTNGRTMIAMQSGIVEPITDAFRRAAVDAPDLFGAFVDDLLRRTDASLPLVNRVWTAVASVAEMNVDSKDDLKRWAKALGRQVRDRLIQEGRED